MDEIWIIGGNFVLRICLSLFNFLPTQYGMWIWLFFSVILGAFGQIFMSIAMKAAGRAPHTASLSELFFYYVNAVISLPMIGAVGCYGFSFLLWLGVLSHKDLSLARPVMSFGYLITLAWGYYAGENVTWSRAVGTFLIVLGLIFVIQSDSTGALKKDQPNFQKEVGSDRVP